MSLVWKDAGAFKQHLENMRLFSRAHRRGETGLPPLQSLPRVACLHPQRQPGGILVAWSALGLVTVPLAPVALAANTQN